MFESILVPTDGSPSAEQAFERGLALAEQFDADLHVQHVVETSRFGDPALSGSALLVDQQEGAGRQVLRDCQSTAASRGVAISMRSCHGAPSREILNYADEHDVDVVVMGYQGQDHRRSLGSTTNKVTRAMDRPVMLV